MRSKALSSPDDDVALVGTLSLVRSARVGANDHALTRWRFCSGRVDVGRHDQGGGDRPRHVCAVPERDEHRAARAPVVGLWRQRHRRARHLHRRRVRAAVVCRLCALSLICALAVTRQQMRVRHRHAGRGGVWPRATLYRRRRLPVDDVRRRADARRAAAARRRQPRPDRRRQRRRRARPSAAIVVVERGDSTATSSRRVGRRRATQWRRVERRWAHWSTSATSRCGTASPARASPSSSRSVVVVALRV